MAWKASIKKSYDLTPDQYDELLDAQRGVCAICEQAQNPRYAHFDIDHDKLTGSVRGLLCRRCNTGLGYLEAGFHLKGLKYLGESK